MTVRWSCTVEFIFPILTSAGVARLGAAVLVSSGAAWEVLARADRAGHSSTLRMTLVENAGVSWWKTTGRMALKKVGAVSWASLMLSLTLVVTLGVVGARLGPQFWQFYNGQPLVQGRFLDRHGYTLACTHLMPGRCVQNLGVLGGTGPAVMTGPVFLGVPHRRLR